jgi:hypothetical protein
LEVLGSNPSDPTTTTSRRYSSVLAEYVKKADSVNERFLHLVSFRATRLNTRQLVR